MSNGGEGSGGSILIEGASVSLSSVTANGGVYGVPGGLGRIAVYYNGSYNGPACTAANSCYLENAGLTPTPTATGAAPTPLPTATTTALPPGSVAYTYGSTTHVHAVTALSNGNSYQYDANGNMTQRVVSGVTWNLTYNAENRTQSLGSDAYTANYLYDGDGARVGQLAGSAVTYYFMGGAYEVSGTLSGGVFTESGHVQYYAIAGQRVAMERGGALNYLLTDQLGSTVALLDGNGALLGKQRYLPFGQVRAGQGTIPQTDLGFTGQRLLGGGSGLMDYRARLYDPGLGRFTQPDAVVPDPNDPQSYNRFTYVRNNSLRYTDPSGHCIRLEEDDDFCLRQDNQSGNYHIVQAGHKRFKNRTETAIADFILSGDPTSLNGVVSNSPVFVGAAVENSCAGLGIDCGNYYQTVFGIMAGGLASWGGAYPAPGAGPGSTGNTSVPNVPGSDWGDYDCAGCGYKKYPAPSLETVQSGTGWGGEKFPKYLPANSGSPYVYRTSANGSINSFAAYNPLSGKARYRVDILSPNAVEHGITGSHLQVADWNLSPTGWIFNGWGATPFVDAFPWP